MAEQQSVNASDLRNNLTMQSGKNEQPSTDPAAAEEVPLPDFAPAVLEEQNQPIELIGDVELNVKVELGRCQMTVEDVLRLAEGSVVELDKLAGDPVDLLVNDRLVARGEVLVLNDQFCIRVNEIVSEIPAET